MRRAARSQSEPRIPHREIAAPDHIVADRARAQVRKDLPAGDRQRAGAKDGGTVPDAERPIPHLDAAGEERARGAAYCQHTVRAVHHNAAAPAEPAAEFRPAAAGDREGLGAEIVHDRGRRQAEKQTRGTGVRRPAHPIGHEVVGPGLTSVQGEADLLVRARCHSVVGATDEDHACFGPDDNAVGSQRKSAGQSQRRGVAPDHRGTGLRDRQSRHALV